MNDGLTKMQELAIKIVRSHEPQSPDLRRERLLAVLRHMEQCHEISEKFTQWLIGEIAKWNASSAVGEASDLRFELLELDIKPE